jgi:uncharacterized membrane protein
VYQFGLLGIGPVPAASATVNGESLEFGVPVAAGTREEINLSIPVQESSPLGTIACELTIRRDDGQEMSQPLSVRVINPYSARVEGMPDSLTVFSGQTLQLDLSVVNTGIRPLTSLYLNLDAPGTWGQQIDPARVEELKSGQSVRYSATITIPASQSAADQTMMVTMVSDQTTTRPTAMTVHIRKDPRVLAYGGLALLAAMAIGFVVYRMRGRR